MPNRYDPDDPRQEREDLDLMNHGLNRCPCGSKLCVHDLEDEDV